MEDKAQYAIGSYISLGFKINTIFPGRGEKKKKKDKAVLVSEQCRGYLDHKNKKCILEYYINQKSNVLQRQIYKIKIGNKCHKTDLIKPNYLLSS